MLRGVEQWGPGWLRSARRRPRMPAGPKHLLFCVADHFEPFRGESDATTARETVEAWCSAYADAFGEFRDADGLAPRHSFFYPGEDYDAACIDRLARASVGGAGEVEVHLHHRNDTAETLREKLLSFRTQLTDQHGLLGRREGAAAYAFVHGNWALCNSRSDGDWCGVDQELTVLESTGCYADLTFPSAPSPTQPRTVNTLYWAKDAPEGPRGHDYGDEAIAGRNPDRDGHLLMIPGPLSLNWRRRKFGVLPRLENAEISGVNPLDAGRIELCVKQHVHVRERPDWIIVKLHTHGCVPRNMPSVLGPAMQAAHQHLARHYNVGDWRLHYVTARELYNIIRAAEAGACGDPGELRDFEVKRPAVLAT